jgi:hypothetical protein
MIESPNIPSSFLNFSFAVISRIAEVQVYLFFFEQNLTFENGANIKK